MSDFLNILGLGPAFGSQYQQQQAQISGFNGQAQYAQSYLAQQSGLLYSKAEQAVRPKKVLPESEEDRLAMEIMDLEITLMLRPPKYVEPLWLRFLRWVESIL